MAVAVLDVRAGSPYAQPRCVPVQISRLPFFFNDTPTTEIYTNHDVRDHITQRRVDRSRARRHSRESSDEDEDDEEGDVEACGAECFCRRSRRTQMTHGFKLPA